MHILQSTAWEKFEKIEGHKTFRVKEKNFNALAIEKSTPLGKYLYLPYGPEIDDAKSLSPALKSLKTLATEQDAFFIRIEPTFKLEAEKIAKSAAKAGLKSKKTKHISPEHTWCLDLTQSEEEILSKFESRKVRYWRNCEKKGIKLRQSQDPEEIGILTNFLKGLAEVDNFTPQDEDHLKNQLKAGFATLYIADLTENEKTFPIAAALIYDYKDTRYYAHAATDFEHRKLVAGTIILIQMIMDAKKNGQKIYDFWGITTSEDPKHPWYGFTQYKKSFGGYQVDYSGTYDIIVNPGKYRLYTLLRKINLLKRKIFKK